MVSLASGARSAGSSSDSFAISTLFYVILSVSWGRGVMAVRFLIIILILIKSFILVMHGILYISCYRYIFKSHSNDFLLSNPQFKQYN